MRYWASYLMLVFNSLNAFSQTQQLLPDTTKLCEGDSVLLNIEKNYDKFNSVIWRTPAGIITNTNRLLVKRGGRYTVEVHSAYFSKQIIDSTWLMLLPKPKANLRDTFICGTNSVILNAGNDNYYYLWNSGEITKSIKIVKPGDYWVKVSNGFCDITDTVKVRVVRSFGNVLPEEVGFCEDEKKVIGIKTEDGTKILWNTGATSPSIAVNREGLYWVKTSLASCGSSFDTVRVYFKECECQMLIPNSFTPNEDGKNDLFFPVSECEYTYFSMTISDRWGNTVFTSNQSNARWDGRFKGNLCPEDIYIYKIESIEKGSDKKQARSGHVSLFR